MLSLYRQKKILSLYRNGISIREINRMMGHSRNTIKKVITYQKGYKYNASSRSSKLDRYKREAWHDHFIEGNSREEVFRQSQLDGFDGSFSVLSKYLTEQKKTIEPDRKKSSEKRNKRQKEQIEWIFNIIQAKLTASDISGTLFEELDPDSIKKLLNYAQSESLRYRNRAISILAYHKK